MSLRLAIPAQNQFALTVKEKDQDMGCQKERRNHRHWREQEISHRFMKHFRGTD